jgi:hypothetical protein
VLVCIIIIAKTHKTLNSTWELAWYVWLPSGWLEWLRCSTSLEGRACCKEQRSDSFYQNLSRLTAFAAVVECESSASKKASLFNDEVGTS